MKLIWTSRAATCLALCGLLASAGTMNARAATIFFDDFESYVEGDPLPNTNGNPWTVPASANSNGNSTVTVAAAQSPFTSGSRGLRLIDGDTTSGTPQPAYTFANQTAGASPTNAALTFSFDFNLGGTEPYNAFVRLQGPGGSGQTGPAIVLDRNATGAVYLRTAGAFFPGASTPAITLASNTWYRTIIDIDMVNRTYTAAIFDGTTTTNLTTGGPIAFESANVPSLTRMEIPDNNGGGMGGTLMFDNFSLTAIPEPGGLSLLALGGSVAFSGARRRR